MVASIVNLSVVLCVVGYNKFTVFASIFFYLFNPIFIPLPWTVILSVVAVVAVFFRYLFSPLPSSLSLVVALGSIPPCSRTIWKGFCYAFIEAPAMVCALSHPTLGICVLFLVLGWHCHPVR